MPRKIGSAGDRHGPALDIAELHCSESDTLVVARALNEEGAEPEQVTVPSVDVPDTVTV